MWIVIQFFGRTTPCFHKEGYWIINASPSKLQPIGEIWHCTKFLKIVPCVVCLFGFPHNDIVTFVCRHLYHPWCALMHFKHSNKCANPHCKTNMSWSGLKALASKNLTRTYWREKYPKVVKSLEYNNSICKDKLHLQTIQMSISCDLRSLSIGNMQITVI